MKIGIIISLALVILLGTIGFLSFWGLPDEPTTATNPDKLVKIDLPTGLRSLTEMNQPNEDATPLYQQAIDYYLENKQAFSEDQAPVRFVNELTRLLIEAMNRGRVSNGFLDRHLPLAPGARPDFEDAFEMIPGVVLQRAMELSQEGDAHGAVEAARAVWSLGRRAFENNVRLYVRSTGVVLMIDASQYLYIWAQEDESLIKPSDIEPWAEALKEIEKSFRKKEELINSHEPHVGDLINIAHHDEDRTFRVAAVLKLGVMKFNPGSRGNARVVDQTLDQAVTSDDEMIAKAAQAAMDLTEEQLHRLY